ncbi:hypothetical protein NPIL_392841 [Nephila pilipes]|uniref:Uncharacterized protein n=1 Tax=Nephila pilipes TaxID=299642 RepID=A0A8X6Q6N4_NEPPI|nr:hypothetical protein NPIL_392841 [Nephila pilipes]
MPRRFRSRGTSKWLRQMDRKARMSHLHLDKASQEVLKSEVRQKPEADIYVHYNPKVSTELTETSPKYREHRTAFSLHSYRNDEGSSSMNIETDNGFRTCCSADDNRTDLICLSGNPDLVDKYGDLIREICSEMYVFMQD